jgi:type I thyroxine 5'-deiodinase
VYILEAHPSDVWQTESNLKDKIVFASPRDAEERNQVAGTCVRKLGIKFPAFLMSSTTRLRRPIQVGPIEST